MDPSIEKKLEVKTKNAIPVLFSNKEDCCGCTACYAICPQNAIDMISDTKGFMYPCIDTNKCIRCGQCLSVCPIKQSS